MSEAKHTPLPWTIERDEQGRPASIGHGHKLIAGLSGPCPEANAEFIVRACNCHDELLGALERYVSKFGDCGEVYTKARAVIAKATS